MEAHTRDGAVLRAWVREPPGGVRARGVFVLAHAIFARASSFGRKDRPGLVDLLSARGYRTITFDFRGHGASKAPRPWRYDDLVRSDVPVMIELARARAEDGEGEPLPVLVAGHSLGGHVALAAHGTGRTKVDGFLVLATNLWLPEIEPSRARRVVKRAFARVLDPILARTEAVPVRRLGLASDDAPSAAVRDILALAKGKPWRSDDGADDYLAALGRVDVPVSAVVSVGDRLACAPSAGAAFARRCGGPVDVVTVLRSDDGGPAPGHMPLATTLRAKSAVERAVGWLETRLSLDARS